MTAELVYPPERVAVGEEAGLEMVAGGLDVQLAFGFNESAPLPDMVIGRDLQPDFQELLQARVG